MEPSWCKSSPVKAVAGRPVASVATHRATGGCEAYTARKQAVRIQLRNRFAVSRPTPLAWRKAVPGCPIMRGHHRIDGVPSPGHASKGAPQEPRRAPYLLVKWVGLTQIRRARPERVRTHPDRERTSVRAGKPTDQGRPEAAGTGREQSYELMVPRKVGNRRAPARGGHGTHWRDGANKRTHR
jgi:hypothetical protein